jgi:MFS transporter, ACS family, hexuronate transporter
MTSRASSWKWWITGVLLLATTINYMDRVTLASASVRVTAEFGLSEAQYGNLELAFGWAFAAGSLAFGILADRLPIYVLYPFVLTAWSVMGVATGFTHSYDELLVCRAFLGFFEAGHWPCALKTSHALLTDQDRTMGNSVLQSGASLGAIITPQVMKFLMTDDPSSWRTPFIAVGAVGLLWVALWFLLLRRSDLQPAVAIASPIQQPGWWTFLKHRRVWAAALLIMGAQIVWHIYRAWLMKFLQTGRGYSEQASLNFSSVYFVATDAGCLLAGLASLWLVRRFRASPHDARRWVYAGACCLTSLSVLIPWLGQGWPLLAVLLLIGAGALALFPCYYSFVQEISASHVGRLTGLLSMWVWAITSPLHSLFGVLVDRTGSYDLGLMIAGLAPWIGVVAMKSFWWSDPAPPSNPERERTESRGALHAG